MNNLFENIRQFSEIDFIPTYTPDKAWSYFNLYYLREIKDIYQLYAKCSTIGNIQILKAICHSENVSSENGKTWTYRNLLEIVNALHKLELLDANNQVKDINLFQSPINHPLTLEDKKVFVQLYLNYIRFSDFHALFSHYYRNNIQCLFCYKEKNRFFNRFISNITKGEERIIKIENDALEVSRFWDVYLKWGEELELIHKYPMKLFGIQYPTLCKDLSIVYLKNEMPSDFSILAYVEKEFFSDYIYLPKLYWEIIIKFGYSIDEINARILEECASSTSRFQLQSTSAIFVRAIESRVLPKVSNKYMSHLLKLR